MRSVRLTTGLILFTYATSHLLNHAFGIRSVDAMQAASRVLLRPWQSELGLSLLYGSFLLHAGLGLGALYRRRHLRLPAPEAWQLVLGLAIPFLVIPHAAGLGLDQALTGMEYGYAQVLYRFFVVSPDLALPRQFVLLAVLWTHGCLGLRAWLRVKRWYGQALPALATLATLVPILALLGVINAGLDIRDALQHGSPEAARWAAATSVEATTRIVNAISIVYLGLVAGVFGLRCARDWHARRYRAVRITYPGHRAVVVPRGFSLLEASRWAGIPHESVCGGKGRCSTCRVRVAAGSGQLTAPDDMERRTLQRIGAPADVRLACQLRPTADVTVEPLVPSRPGATRAAARYEAAVAGGREVEIVAMFIDLRESTRLAAGRLPYDALFLFDRFIQVVTGAVLLYGGEVTSVAGDGVMSVFGHDGPACAAACAALAAAADAWAGIDALNHELSVDLVEPLRIGIGIHAGTAVMGWIASPTAQSLQFLGDTGNIAAKLEEHSRVIDCTLVASATALNLAGLAVPATTPIAIAGQGDPVAAAVFKARDELQQALARTSVT